MEATMQLWLKQTFTKVDSTNVWQTKNSFMKWTLLALYTFTKTHIKIIKIYVSNIAIKVPFNTIMF